MPTLTLETNVKVSKHISVQSPLTEPVQVPNPKEFILEMSKVEQILCPIRLLNVICSSVPSFCRSQRNTSWLPTSTTRMSRSPNPLILRSGLRWYVLGGYSKRSGISSASR
jgi:hypothetical protein